MSVDEDKYVAPVEEIFAAVARDSTAITQSRERPIATHALWLCTCVCEEDAPTWLIYETPESELFWQRVPAHSEALGLVHAQRYAGGHVSPYEVLCWLEVEDDPWGIGSDVSGDDAVLPELRRKIRGS